MLNLITVILTDRRDNNATKDGDNCGYGHFLVSCLFLRGLPYVILEFFLDPREWCTKLFPSLALFLFDLIDKLIAFDFSYGTFLFFFLSADAACCCTHGIKPINSILYDPARFQQAITAPDTLSIYS